MPIVVIGGGRSCDIQLADSTVGGRHLLVTCVGGEVFVEDLRSGEPTFVNDVAITEPTRVGYDDMIVLGETAIVLEPSSILPEPTVEQAPAQLSQVERDFLATLRANPGDDTTRLIYADWLEAEGHRLRAGFIRLELASEARIETSELVAEALRVTDPAWRATVACGDIRHCGHRECPKTWNRLVPHSDFVRGCNVCASDVVYCVIVEDVEECAEERDPAVYDAGLEAYSSDEAYVVTGPIRR
jgi:uncharacterized protein (TIGR02996 family)